MSVAPTASKCRSTRSLFATGSARRKRNCSGRYASARLNVPCRGACRASEPPHANAVTGANSGSRWYVVRPRKWRHPRPVIRSISSQTAASLLDRAHRAHARAFTAAYAFLLVDRRQPVSVLADCPNRTNPQRGAGMIGRTAIRVYVHDSHLSRTSIRDRAVRYSDDVTKFGTEVPIRVRPS
jgi:hypothetical protein